MPRSRFLPFASVIVCALALSGCDESLQKRMKHAPGAYDGTVTTWESGRSEQFAVSAELKGSEGRGIHALVRSRAGQSSWELDLRPSGRKALELDAGKYGQFELKRVSEGCFEGGARLCFDGPEISLQVGEPKAPRFLLLLTRATENAVPELEAPAPFSVGELRTRARDRAFNSRIELEQSVRGRLIAHNAHMNLLPHFSSGEALGAALSFQWMSLVRSVGNLAPFLFPGRWFRAGGASAMARAERQGWLLARADSGHIAEGIALTILRDEEALGRMRERLAPLEDLRDRLIDRERLGVSPPGASDDIAAVVASVKKAASLLDGAVAEEYAALAQVSGFFNPHAVSSVRKDGESGWIEVPAATELEDEEWVRTVALERSVELRQMDELIAQARSETRARKWDWFDPSGTGGGIGLQIPSYIEISRSSERELAVRRQQIQALVLQSVVTALSERAAQRRSFGIARETLEIHNRRVERLTNDLRLGVPVSFLELQSALLDQLRAEMDELDARYGYAVTAGKIQRLLYIGPYAGFTE